MILSSFPLFADFPLLPLYLLLPFSQLFFPPLVPPLSSVLPKSCVGSAAAWTFESPASLSIIFPSISLIGPILSLSPNLLYRMVGSISLFSSFPSSHLLLFSPMKNPFLSTCFFWFLGPLPSFPSPFCTPQYLSILFFPSEPYPFGSWGVSRSTVTRPPVLFFLPGHPFFFSPVYRLQSCSGYNRISPFPFFNVSFARFPIRFLDPDFDAFFPFFSQEVPFSPYSKLPGSLF